MQLPLFETPSLWTPPSFLHQLKGVKEIAIDTECRDPLLTTWGSGAPIGEGHLAGVGIAARVDGSIWKAYLPIGHFGGGNLDKAIVTAYLKDICGRSDINYIFLHADYDLLWLKTLGIEIGGTITDVGVVETLIDEENPAGYGLDAIAHRRLGRRKDEAGLRRAANEYSLNNPKADMWKLPARHVGQYAEVDPELTLLIWEDQQKDIKAQNLEQIVKLEQAVTPILADMHWKGLPVDLGYAEELNAKWLKSENELLRSLKLHHDDLWTTECLVRIAKAEGLTVPRTAATKNFPEGQESINKGWLEEQARKGNKRMEQILHCRGLNRCRETYLEQNLIQNVRNGHIYPEYVQVAMEDGDDGMGGTRTGRLACKKPNAQQFPKRSKLFDAKALRYALRPPKSSGLKWSKGDYWSQEPVLQCHYGLLMNLPKAREVCEQFKKNIKLYSYIETATKGRCNYDQAKETVLGRGYGMGAAKMAARMGIPLDECYDILKALDEEVPYITQLAQDTANLAKRRGYIKTICGRRRHFNKWTVISSREERRQQIDFGAWDTMELAVAAYESKFREMNPGHKGPIAPRQFEHAFAYKALNALIQGGSADQTKTALVYMKQASIPPRMTVHDEVSTFTSTEKEHKLHQEIMETCVKLLAPVRADMSLGEHWQ